MSDSSRGVIIAKLDPPNCPHCESQLNSLCGDSMPDSGDIAFCVYCLKTSIFSIHPTSITLRVPITMQERNDCEEAAVAIIGSDRLDTN